jgi:hypothetical protein
MDDDDDDDDGSPLDRIQQSLVLALSIFSFLLTETPGIGLGLDQELSSLRRRVSAEP